MDALKRAFCEYLLRKIPCPSKEVARVIENIPCLNKRGTKRVKYQLDNLIRKKWKKGTNKFLLASTALDNLGKGKFMLVIFLRRANVFIFKNIFAFILAYSNLGSHGWSNKFRLTGEILLKCPCDIKIPHYFSHNKTIPEQKLTNFLGKLKTPYVLLFTVNHFFNFINSLRKLAFDIFIFF